MELLATVTGLDLTAAGTVSGATRTIVAESLDLHPGDVVERLEVVVSDDATWSEPATSVEGVVVIEGEPHALGRYGGLNVPNAWAALGVYLAGASAPVCTSGEATIRAWGHR